MYGYMIHRNCIIACVFTKTGPELAGTLRTQKVDYVLDKVVNQILLFEPVIKLKLLEQCLRKWIYGANVHGDSSFVEFLDFIRQHVNAVHVTVVTVT